MESQWDCSICYSLLLDPVVGKCGHDFCKDCLLNWTETCTSRGKAVACPLCRTELAETKEGVKSLGVCVRLKQTVELLFPEKIAERRRDAEARRTPDEKGGVVAQRAQAGAWARAGRARYIRVRRTRPSANASAGAVQLAVTGPGTADAGHLSQLPPALRALLQQHQQQAAPAQAVPLQGGAYAPAAAGSPGANPWSSTSGTPDFAAYAQYGMGMSPAAMAAGGGSTPAGWVTPPVVSFTMGWWEEPTGTRRKRARANRGSGPRQHRRV